MYTFIPLETLILLNSPKSLVSSTTFPLPFIDPVKTHEPKMEAIKIAVKMIAAFFMV
jgi:hypothetical protein